MLPFPQIAPVISVISVINVINQCLQHCNLPVRWHAVRSLAHLQMITPITLMTVFQQTGPRYVRSEEHTSELQSHLNLVCRLLLEKKKKTLDHHAGCKARPCADHSPKSTAKKALSDLYIPYGAGPPRRRVLVAHGDSRPRSLPVRL